MFAGLIDQLDLMKHVQIDLKSLLHIGVAFLLTWCIAPALAAQPTIDGSVAGDSDYITLGQWTQDETGFGDHGMVELRGYADGSNLYVAVVGECESNGNEFFVFIGHDDAGGISAGTALPGGDDNISPFASFQPTNDFEVDYGLRITASADCDGDTAGDQPCAFASVIDYVNLTGGGQGDDQFRSSISVDGAPTTYSGGPYVGMTIAYNDTGTLSANTGVEGLEFSIPLSSIGATPASEFQLFAAYGNDDFFSANTLPEIAGQSGSNLGSNPDFSSISGDQHSSSSPLPVELTAFDARSAEDGVQLTWTTASETNNAGFEVQRQPYASKKWHAVRFIEGAGTTSQMQRYHFTDTDLPYEARRVTYRLRQVDFDGGFEYSGEIEVALAAPKEVELHPIFPNPSRGLVTLRYSLPRAQDVRISLYNTLGQEVAVPLNKTVEAGSHELQLDFSGRASGLYLLRLESAGVSQTKQFSIVR